VSRTRSAGPHGIVLVDKPCGPSSADVVDWMRWALGGQSVGHFGTLDPNASGLLVCGVGWASRLNPYVMAEDKGYRATIAFGRATDTEDAEGSTVAESSWDAGTLERASRAIEGMHGALDLPPPKYSALKVAGQRAHAMARAGLEPDLGTRLMEIRSVDDVEIDAAQGELRATLCVSKGTYVRSLAVELGRRVGCHAHLRALRRLGSGAARVDDPRALRNFSVEPWEARHDGKPRFRIRCADVDVSREAQGSQISAAMLEPSSVLSFPRGEVRGDDEGSGLLRSLSHGRAIAREDRGWIQAPPPDGLLGVCCASVPGLIVARCSPDLIRPERTIIPFFAA